MSSELATLLGAVEGLTEQQRALTLEFHRLLELGNQRQNLTRLVSPADFYRGHFLDAWEGARFGGFEGACLDFGSGCGVPGLLLAALLPQTSWDLVESETRKAEFLQETSAALGLENRVRVTANRVEKVIQALKPTILACRAVAKLPEMQNWVLPCSTWNKWILYKGPKWDEEWSDYLRTQGPRRPLQELKRHEYSVAGVELKRVLVTLTRT